MTIEERLAERPDIAKCRDVIDRARGSGLNKVRLSAFDEVAAYAELLEARVESAERRAAEQVEMFERQAAAVRHHTVRADAAEHQRATATAALETSEEWRKAYQKGKHELYAMGGDVQQAAMTHLPCNESGLDSRFTRLLEMPRLKAKDEEITALLARLAAAEHQRDKALAALATFGKHPTTCTAWRTTYWKPPLECDCGLAAALTAHPATEGD